MTQTAVRFRLPQECAHCGAQGTVVPETTITGGTVMLKWCCRSCGRDWPITNAEQQLEERRSGQVERRRITRTDRRGRKPPP